MPTCLEVKWKLKTSWEKIFDVEELWQVMMMIDSKMGGTYTKTNPTQSTNITAPRYCIYFLLNFLQSPSITLNAR